MNHPIINELTRRHTVKKYDANRKVPPADLAILFEAMRLSASSINSQPWKFIVVESEAAKTRLSNTFAHMHEYNKKHVFDSSQVILFAHNPKYTRDDYAKVVDQGIKDKRTPIENREAAFAVYSFAELNTSETGDNSSWTKAQTYLALGNTLHVLARLNIDSTPMEGIDVELVNKEFSEELAGYQCDVALAIGYHHPEEDFNAKLPKSRLPLNDVLVRI
ncbi:nitroreductase family protein [Colwellia ponticola]|uniref:NAD(P)H-dependent oxidoreductase n=1 Tax=Colwellia ponticola TaxID=2304625 RepID=A0A8H2JPY5_9GAMM|nr:nitroreductase family protein [Colwellia ponticola]TMM47936.1 NAD(P)H-dependent oxidoreductase [Colwellia ponticola]